MAHPKHKVSSTRRDKRRTHYKAVVPTVVACSNCGAAVLYHRVCPECGFYRGKLAIEKEAESFLATREPPHKSDSLCFLSEQNISL